MCSKNCYQKNPEKVNRSFLVQALFFLLKNYSFIIFYCFLIHVKKTPPYYRFRQHLYYFLWFLLLQATMAQSLVINLHLLNYKGNLIPQGVPKSSGLCLQISLITACRLAAISSLDIFSVGILIMRKFSLSSP